MPRKVHYLSDVNPEARTATCAACGPVSIRKAGPRWRCQIAANKSKHYKGEVGSKVRYRRHLGDSCERCGFVPEHPAQMDVHHIDGNHSNDAEENLATLCANCHRLHHATEPR